MKKYVLLIFIVLSAFFAKSQSVNYKIDGKLSINFPAQPTKLDERSVFMKTSDSLVYVVQVIDCSAMGLDSIQLKTSAPTPEFSESFKSGLLSTMKGATVGPINISTWKNHTCYNFDGANTTSKMKFYGFVVFIGANVYNMMCIMPESKSTSGKDSFFSSLTPN